MDHLCPCIQLHNMQTLGTFLQDLEPAGKNIIYAIYLEEIVNETKAFDFLIEGIKDLSLLSAKWNSFWREKGNELVLKTWMSKYKDYLDTNYLHKFQKNLKIVADIKCGNTDTKILTKNNNDEFCYCGLIELDEILNIFDPEMQKITVSDLNSLCIFQDWDTLWERHYINQYKVNFKIFSEIFSSLSEISKINVKHRRSTCIKSQISYENCEEYVSDDCNAQLTALGLPTSFGSKMKKKLQIRFSENFYDTFYETYTEGDDDFSCTASVISENFSESCNTFSSTLCEKSKFNPELFTDKIEQASIDKDGNAKTGEPGEQLASNKKPNLPTLAPPEILNDKNLFKYWKKRFSLFSRFDEGIMLDKESWFSVTPEKIGRHIARRLRCAIIVDAFCGSGGNSIQFAFACDKVIAVDIDPIKILLAKHNAKIYGVEKKIEFITADFLHIYHHLRADVIFLSPPWGGPSYVKSNLYDIEKDLLPLPASRLLEICRKITLNIALYLPRNSDIQKVVKTACKGDKVEVEKNFLGGKTIALTAYYEGYNVLLGTLDYEENRRCLLKIHVLPTPSYLKSERSHT